MSKYPISKPIFDTLENITIDSILTDSPTFDHFDHKAAFEFLNQYSENKATFEAYRREVERLLQWCWHIAEKLVLFLKRQDIEDYLEFCLNPPIVKADEI